MMYRFFYIIYTFLVGYNSQLAKTVFALNSSKCYKEAVVYCIWCIYLQGGFLQAFTTISPTVIMAFSSSGMNVTFIELVGKPNGVEKFNTPPVFSKINSS